MKQDRRLEGAIDFHTHILPGMDHGSRDLGEAIAQWQMLTELGIPYVVATPHFYAQTEPSVEDFLVRRDAAADALCARVSGGPRLVPGAEVLLCRGLENMQGLDRLCIKGTNVILLEMPLSGFDYADVKTVERIAALGLLPLIAHIDRCSPAALALLYDSGCARYQVNAEAFLGFSRRAAFFRRMAKDGAIAAIGSDLHNADARALRSLCRALDRLGPAADMICAQSRALLADAHFLEI